MLVEIKRWDTGAVIWSGEAESLRDALEKAVVAGARLDDASLEGERA